MASKKTYGGSRWQGPIASKIFMATPEAPTPGPSETEAERRARERVTATDYYKYLRSLQDAPEVAGWRPDYKRLYQDPVKYGGTEGFEPTPTTFVSAPVGVGRDRNVMGDPLSNPTNPLYYYSRKTLAIPRNGQPDIQVNVASDPWHSSAGLVRTLEAIKYARSRGIPLPVQATDPHFLAAKFLKEVRDEGGANPALSHTYSRPVRQLHNQLDALVRERFGSSAADHLVQLAEKDRVSRKTGIDFNRAWNGTGVTDYGGTGANYAARMRRDFLPAVQHPRNAEFIKFIQSRLDPNTPYMTPMTAEQYEKLQRAYQDRVSKARREARNKLSPLRDVQQALFGTEQSGTLLGRVFGLPDRLNPNVIADRVPRPDYQKLTQYGDPLRWQENYERLNDPKYKHTGAYGKGGLASSTKPPKQEMRPIQETPWLANIADTLEALRTQLGNASVGDTLMMGPVRRAMRGNWTLPTDKHKKDKSGLGYLLLGESPELYRAKAQGFNLTSDEPNLGNRLDPRIKPEYHQPVIDAAFNAADLTGIGAIPLGVSGVGRRFVQNIGREVPSKAAAGSIKTSMRKK